MPSGVNWLVRAANQDFAPAEVNLGILYANGVGVAHDDEEALHWFKKAARKHFATAEFLLGTMYETGAGVSLNYEEAAGWYRKAAGHGHPMAQNNLGGMYQRGQGVSQDLDQAKKLFTLAAQQGNAVSCANLATLNMGANGFPRDDRAAYFWAILAERVQVPGMSTSVPELAGRLRPRLSPEQAAGAEAEAAQWVKEHTFSSQGWDLVELKSAPASLAARR